MEYLHVWNFAGKKRLNRYECSNCHEVIELLEDTYPPLKCPTCTVPMKEL